MKQRSIRVLADYLVNRPIGRIVAVRPVADDDYIVSIEDRRYGREHVLETPEDLETWLDTLKQGWLLQPTKAFCDCCGNIHTDRDTDGELFELCAGCQAELAAFTFEQT